MLLAVTLTACSSRRGTRDFAAGCAATCEVHGSAMSRQKVGLDFGMKAITETDRARQRLFPHADEPYDTGWCIPPRERYAVVFVCPQCTDARAKWFATHNTNIGDPTHANKI